MKTYEFSGVTWPKLALMIAPLEPVLKRFGSVQVPKYFLPFAFMAASMLCAAWRSSRMGSGSAKGAAETSAVADRRVTSESFMVEIV
jgi:hypothetical protein